MTRNVAYYQKNRPLKIFLSYYGPHKHLFFLDMFCALVICLIDLAFPYLSRSALNHLLPQQEYRVFFLLIGFFAVAYVGKGLLYFVCLLLGARLWRPGRGRSSTGPVFPHGELELQLF